MLHLIILILIALLIWQSAMLIGRVIWLCVLLVSFCVMSMVTAVLVLVLGVQKLIVIVGDWRWRPRYGNVLPPSPRE